MAKSQPKIDDVQLLQDVLAAKLEAITTSMVEAVLTGVITSHQHDYATSSQGNKADTAIQGVSVNNTELASDDNKKVNITVPTTVSELSDSNEYAHLSNGKILEGNLPDYIFGQVLFGGFVEYNPANNNLVCTLSDKLKSKYNVTDNTLILGNMPASTYEGVYFIATNDFMTSIDVKIGDWLISNGSTWSKVDNTDAVVSVNGNTGVIFLTPADVGAAPNNHTHNYESLANLPEIISVGEFLPSEINLEDATETYVRPLYYGRKYYSAPDKICGTDEMRDDLEGFLFVYMRGGILSQQLHDTLNNILYIRSFNRISGEWSLWKRLLTCRDEIATEPEVVDRYTYLIDKTNTYIYIDTTKEDFVFKDDTIIIDLANYSSPGYILKISIYFNPDTGSPVNVNIIDSANPGKQIKYGNSPHYVDPGSVGSLYCINYEIACFIPYWLVGNRIYS